MAIALVVGLVRFYIWLIIAYVLMSWFRPGEGLLGDIYRVLGSVVEPYIGIFRRIVPVVSMGAGGLDLSPLVAILVLQLVLQFAVRILYQF